MRLLSLLFFLIGFLLLLFGIGALGAGLVVRSTADLPDGFAWKTPLSLVDSKALAPATVFLPLTGADATQSLGKSLERGHWENALAVIAYEPALSDPARVGVLLQLAERFATRRQSSKAAWCYQFAARVATISPALADTARLDTYLQAAAGLRGLKASESARLAVDQAFLVAQYSPALRREVRAQRLNQVAEAYDALNLSDLAAQARAKASEVSDATSGLARAPFTPSAGSLPASPDVERALGARVAAAKALAVEMEDRDKFDAPADLEQNLGDALLNEEDARAAFYNQQFAQSKGTAILIALRRDQLNWLAIKSRVARGAFGANLVPEWTPRALEFGAQASEVWAEFFRLSETQANGFTDAVERDRALEDVYRQELLAIRWGWFTGAAENDVPAAIAEVTQRLAGAAPGLRLDRVTRGNQALDLLVPDELFGMNDRALPK